MNPQIVIRGYKRALEFCLNDLNRLVIQFQDNPQERRSMLIKCAETALNSKLLSSYKNFFAEIVVSAVEKLDTNLLDKDLIGIKEVTGGSINDSLLVSGVAFKKTFSYAGFEQQPKSFTNPKIIILKIELELKSEKENAEIRISNVDDFQSIVDAEWQIIYDKLKKIHEVGAQIVLSKLPIGDLATQWFADRGIFCAGRVPQDDINRVAKATGAVLQTTVNNVAADVLGTCGKFQEKQIGAERFNLFEECPSVYFSLLRQNQPLSF
jgi:T-complex protein 1 subunit eta